MKKFNIKNFKTLIIVTVGLVVFSTFLLWESISFASEKGIEKISDTTISSMENDNNPNTKQLEFKKQEKGIQEKAPTVEYLSRIKSLEGNADLKKQEALYQSVKGEINITKEDAKEILENKINSIFGDMIGISDSEIFFMELAESKSYEWWLTLANEKTKKNYWCVLNALTGECVLLNRVDYTGLQKPEYGSIISKDDVGKLQDNKLNLYIKKAKEIITEKSILNIKNNSVKDISFKRTLYLGLRPIAEISIVMEDGKEVRMAFYTDTDELTLIDLQ
jgi:hypothetical protein